MGFIPKNKITWREVRYLKIPLELSDNEATWLYKLWLNEPLASWDVFSYWEVARVLSMQTHLKKGNVLFDIGTEQGWCNLVYAQMVGPANMVLIEPTPEFWPNIKALWQKNYDVAPKAFYNGFFSDKIAGIPGLDYTKWPAASEGDLIDRNSYRYLSNADNAREVQQITLDEFVKRSGIVPDALTIDTEGAELLILKGAINTLKTYHPKVWVSEHINLQLQDFGIKDGEIEAFMKTLGFSRELLAEDHERHVFYNYDKS